MPSKPRKSATRHKIEDADASVVRLIDPTACAYALALCRLNAAINVLRRQNGPLDQAKADITGAMAIYADEYDADKLAFLISDSLYSPRALVKLQSNQGAPRIDREKLLEKGVDPAAIDYATTRTPSSYWKVEELPPEETA